MIDLRDSLTLYANHSLTEALNVPVSVGSEFFSGKAFKNWEKTRENDVKIQVAIVNGISAMITTIGNFMKALARWR